jgi:catechol 2,3-dioxygenase-like lactoylglutathione lyase family enzyme
MTEDTTVVYAAVPVLRVASVARSVAWYADVLGFTGDAVGPPADPVFAILRRDDVELMLQKTRAGIPAPRAAARPEGGWDVYLRIDDAEAFRERVRARIPDVGALLSREYGCRELALSDPDGHVIVLGECGRE